MAMLFTAPKVEIMMATAIARAAPLAQEAVGDVDGDQIAFRIFAGHGRDGDDVDVGQVDQDVDGDDDERP